MRVAICDDDHLFVSKLKAFLEDYFNKCSVYSVQIVAYPDGFALLNDSTENDLVFLDIEMPGISGIDVGKQIKGKNNNTIIFIITSYSEYLDDAMRFHVFRYLSKPLDMERLRRNLNDALQLYFTSTNRVTVETKDMSYIIPSSEIIYIESVGHCSSVQTITDKYLSIQNMSYWSSTLNNRLFFQSHKSFLINMRFVTSYDHSMIRLYDNQYSAYLTRRKYNTFKAAYMLYLESIR